MSEDLLSSKNNKNNLKESLLPPPSQSNNAINHSSLPLSEPAHIKMTLPTSSSSTSSNRYTSHVFIMSAAFFGLFMAFNTAQALQSSINGTLGNVCLAVLYATFTLACISAPKAVDYLGPKLSMIIGAIPYVLMILSNLQPSYYLSVPANFLVGLGAPLLWTGEGVYIQRCAARYAQKSGVSESTSTSYLNGIFFSSFQANGVAGLLLSSIILQTVGDNSKNILFIVLTVLGGFGVAIMLLMPNVAPLLDSSSPSSSSSSTNSVSLIQTLQLAFSSSKMFLLIPLIFYNGMSLGFIFGDYTRFVISKAAGTDWDGYVMAAFYGCNAAFTLLFGKLAALPTFGRKWSLRVATTVHAAFFVFLLGWNVPENFTVDDDDNWTKQADTAQIDYLLLFVGALLFAAGDAVFESQPPAILQNYFSSSDLDINAAMSNLKMWQSLGFTAQFILGFVLADYFEAKVGILLGLLIIAWVFWAYLDGKVAKVDTDIGETVGYSGNDEEALLGTKAA